MTGGERESGNGSSFLGPRIVAAVLVLGGIGLVISAIGIARGGGYSVVGPATIPLVVAIGVLVLGVTFVLRTTALPDHDLAEQATSEEARTHWPTVGLIGLLLVVYALALDGFRLGELRVPGLGYPLATGLFLPLAARTLGSRSPVRDVLAGFGIGIVLYVTFTEFLGVRLPPGLLDLIP